MDFDTTVTSSSAQQRSLESKVANLTSRASDNHEKPLLDKEGHITYLQKGLASLPQSFTSLESSRPWLLYWIIHSLALLQADLPQDVSLEGSAYPLINFLIRNTLHPFTEDTPLLSISMHHHKKSPQSLLPMSALDLQTLPSF